MKNLKAVLLTGLLIHIFFFSFSQTQFHINPHGFDTICHGDSIMAEAQSGFSSYLWSNGNHDRVIKIKTAGKYVCTAVDANGHSYKDSIIVSIFPFKTLQIGSNPHPAVLCKGQKLTLEATSGFLAYHWSHGLTGRVVTAYPTTSEYFVVEAEDSNGCSRRESIYVTVNNCDSCSIIQTGAHKALCGNHDSVVLEAKYGYASYSWNTGSHARGFWVKQPGWYKVEVVDSSGKVCKDSIHIIRSLPSVTIYSNPSPAKICKNALLIVEASTGFVSYNWSNGLKGARLELHPEHSGLLILEAVNEFGCEARDTLHIIVDTCTGINFQNIKKPEIYPNPARQYFTVRFPVSTFDIAVYDVTGKLIFEQKDLNENINIPVSNLINGVYAIRITSENSGIFTQRLMIIK